MSAITTAFCFLVLTIFSQNGVTCHTVDPMYDIMVGLFDFKPSNRILKANDIFVDPKMMYETLYKTVLCDDSMTETISDKTKIRLMKPYNRLFKQLSLYKKPNAGDWARIGKGRNRKSRNQVSIMSNEIKNVNSVKSNDDYVWAIFKHLNSSNE